MLFHCFLDDSKDKSQTQVYISAGFIGIEDDWKAFRILWNEILSTNKIRYFKSSEYNWLEGEFSRFKTDAYPRPSGRQAAKKIKDELLGTARCFTHIRGVGIAIPVPIYRKVCRLEDAKLFFDTPDLYRRALEGVFNETIKQIELLPGENAVLFVHDEGPDWDQLDAYYREYRIRNPRHAKKMAGFVPLDDKRHPPLQLADALANQSVGDGTEWLANGQVTLEDEKEFNLCKLGVWDEATMLRLLRHTLKTRGLPISEELETLCDKVG